MVPEARFEVVMREGSAIVLAQDFIPGALCSNT